MLPPAPASLPGAAQSPQAPPTDASMARGLVLCADPGTSQAAAPLLLPSSLLGKGKGHDPLAVSPLQSAHWLLPSLPGRGSQPPVPPPRAPEYTTSAQHRAAPGSLPAGPPQPEAAAAAPRDAASLLSPQKCPPTTGGSCCCFGIQSGSPEGGRVERGTLARHFRPAHEIKNSSPLRSRWAGEQNPGGRVSRA